ncbi:MAG TPA: HAD-IB family hydrolase [Puia sp.]|nr:HAD-IB family hydrolase [Puia sp.]
MDKIAFFDFDGTITEKDTLLEFIIFTKGKMNFYKGFLLKSPWLVAYKIKLISNQRAKEAVMRFFFGKMSVALFEEHCLRFATERIPGLVRPKAGKEIDALQEKGFSVVIVSASPGNWILPWARTIQADLIATRLETRTDAGGQERLTGKISGKNCHGEEKVQRIRQQFKLEDYQPIHAYGDSAGDRPMLALAHHSFMKPFR